MSQSRKISEIGSTPKKALRINADEGRYGTFAEIGAGQEVARHFFQAGLASQTVAKTMSAYDMVFSDEIYGKADRYVSQGRLVKMLEHEFYLLQQRLEKQRGQKTQFFAFADTVSTSSHNLQRCHGWMGVRFQEEPGAPHNDIVIHVRMLERQRLQQQEVLGLLGVNLLYAAFYLKKNGSEMVASLTDSIGEGRMEIDMIRTSGPAFAHLDNRLLSLELVLQKLSPAVLFAPDGQVLHASDAFFGKNLLVQRGAFRPVTLTNVEILERGLEQMRQKLKLSEDSLMVLFEITMKNLQEEGKVDPQDFLNRVDSLGQLGHPVLISDFFLFYQLKSYLRQRTDQWIVQVIGAAHLEKLFAPEHYRELPGGILEGFSRLFDERTKMFVFPYKSDQICSTAQSFFPEPRQLHLFKHLMDNQWIEDILGCDDVDTSIHSADVRNMLIRGDTQWEALVPPAVRDYIKSHKLFLSSPAPSAEPGSGEPI